MYIKIRLPIIAALSLGLFAAEAYGGQAIPITSIEQLQRIADVGDTDYPLNGNYILLGDIDASAYSGDYLPIGSSLNPFVGQFDGQGFAIAGLTISRPGENRVGVFGVLSVGATVQRLRLEGGSIAANAFVGAIAGDSPVGTIIDCHSTADVSGNAQIGGLVGQNSGVIQRCSASGMVTSTSFGAGGMVGRNVGGKISESYTAGIVEGVEQVGGLIGYETSGDIKDCYSMASVSGTAKVGGLIGFFNGTGLSDGNVENAYAAGPVSGTTDVGGLLGSFTGGSVRSCYWDDLTAGHTGSPYGLGAGSGAMTHKLRYDSWDFEAIWIIEEGVSYPYFGGMHGQNPPPVPARKTIGSLDELQEIGNNPAYPAGGVYDLTTDLDGTGYTGYTPVGMGGELFEGHFDGRRHTIRNVTIDGTGANNVGLFSVVQQAGEVRNLRLENVTVTGTQRVGGITGVLTSNSAVKRCSVTGVVSASTAQAGGLAGYNLGRISECYTVVDVSSPGSSVGGLVGETLFAEILDSYAMGSVQGNISVGGLVGFLDDGNTIARTFATGSVMGTGNVGGLVGRYAPSISNSFWDRETTGQPNTEDFVGGRSTAEMQMLANFTPPNATFDFESVWAIHEGESYPFLRTFNLGGPGDVNGDGVVDAVDVQLVINAALGVFINAAFSADVNLDGMVNAVDIQSVTNAALGAAP